MVMIRRNNESLNLQWVRRRSRTKKIIYLPRTVLLATQILMVYSLHKLSTFDDYFASRAPVLMRFTKDCHASSRNLIYEYCIFLAHFVSAWGRTQVSDIRGVFKPTRLSKQSFLECSHKVTCPLSTARQPSDTVFSALCNPPAIAPTHLFTQTTVSTILLLIN
jgi:hypothetical protein